MFSDIDLAWENENEKNVSEIMMFLCFFYRVGEEVPMEAFRSINQSDQ